MDIFGRMIIQAPYNCYHRKYYTKHNFRHMAENRLKKPDKRYSDKSSGKA